MSTSVRKLKNLWNVVFLKNVVFHCKNHIFWRLGLQQFIKHHFKIQCKNMPEKWMHKSWKKWKKGDQKGRSNPPKIHPKIDAKKGCEKRGTARKKNDFSTRPKTHKIRPGPEAPEACWDRALVRSTFHTPYLSEEFFCRCPSEVPSEGGRAKGGGLGVTGLCRKTVVFSRYPSLFAPFFRIDFWMDFWMAKIAKIN